MPEDPIIDYLALAHQQTAIGQRFEGLLSNLVETNLLEDMTVDQVKMILESCREVLIGLRIQHARDVEMTAQTHDVFRSITDSFK